MLRLLLLLFSLVFSSVTLAMQEQYGRVNINGAIINPACTILAENAEQTVDLGIITQQNIEQHNSEIIYPFAIRLTNCILATSKSSLGSWQTFSMMFDGPSALGNRGFTLGDQSQGLAFEIRDEQDNTVIPRAAMKLNEHSVANKTLNYSLHLVKTSQQVKPGPFYTAVSFILIYQ
ncbi:fimbrial protein [Serratia sp. L9]|uniref:fimbrial protein n=1 Tax=Serratia sp. L9 TaxID=3423946 RepID=UPI003D672A59